MQTAIPFMMIRGGSSKGVFLHKKDLPTDQEGLNKVLLAIMEGAGCGDPRQVDGLGGADSLTSKIAIVSPSEIAGFDLDYLFIQVVIGTGQLATVQNCGNILAGVVPFAIEAGILPAVEGHTTAVVRMMNSNSLCEVTIETPHRKVNYQGDSKVDGVPGTAAPIICNYLDIAGKNCGALLPTGHVKDLIDGIELTAVDNGMPVVLLRASDLGLTGYESKVDLDKDKALKDRLENIRLKIGPKMTLGDVRNKTVPKMCIISPARHGGLLNTRTFIPHVCHSSIGVLGAVSAATGSVLKGSVADGIIDSSIQLNAPLSIEHPSGELTVNLTIEEKDGTLNFKKSGVLRTARLISKGEVFIPDIIGDGRI